MGQGQRSTLKVKVNVTRSKCDLWSHLTLQVISKVMGQGQMSRGSRSKVEWVKPSLRAMILAGGLMSTSSCIFKSFTSTWKSNMMPALYCCSCLIFNPIFYCRHYDDSYDGYGDDYEREIQEYANYRQQERTRGSGDGSLSPPRGDRRQVRAGSPYSRSPDRYDDSYRDRYSERYRGDNDSQSGDRESTRSSRRREYREDRYTDHYEERTSSSKRERTRGHSPTSSEYSHGRSPTRYRSRSPSPGALRDRKVKGGYSPSRDDYPHRSSRASSPGYVDSYGRTKDRGSLKSDKVKELYMDRDRRERYDSEERTHLSSLIGTKTGQMFSDAKKKRDLDDDRIITKSDLIRKNRLSDEFLREHAARKLGRQLSHGSKDSSHGRLGDLTSDSSKMGAPKNIPDHVLPGKHKRKSKMESRRRSKSKHKKDQPYDPFDDMDHSASSSNSSSSGSSSSDSDSDMDTDASHHDRDSRSGSQASGRHAHADVSKLQEERDDLIKMIKQLDNSGDGLDDDGGRRPFKRARLERMLEMDGDSPRLARLREVEDQIKAKEAAIRASLSGFKPDASLSLRKQMEAQRLKRDHPKGADTVVAAPRRSRDPLGLMSPNDSMDAEGYNSGPEKSPRDMPAEFLSKKKRRDTLDDGHKGRKYRSHKTEDMYSSGDEDNVSHKSSSSSVRPRLSMDGKKSGFESEGSTKSETHDRSRSSSKTEVIVPLYVVGPDVPQDPRTPRSPERDRRDCPIDLAMPKFGIGLFQKAKVAAKPAVTKPLTVTIHNTPTTASAPLSAVSLTSSPHLSPGSNGLMGSPTFSPAGSTSPQLSPTGLGRSGGKKQDLSSLATNVAMPAHEDLDEPPPPPPPPPPNKQSYVEAYLTSQAQIQQEMGGLPPPQQIIPHTPEPNKDGVFTVPSTDSTPQGTTPKSAERDPRKRRDSAAGSLPAMSPVRSEPDTPPVQAPTAPADPADSSVRPSLEERIRALDEKLNLTQTAVQNTTKSVTNTTVMDYREKFRVKKKGDPSTIIKNPSSGGETSDIAKTLLSRKSIFDQDSRRLENIDEKYEPKEGQRIDVFRTMAGVDPSVPGQEAGLMSPPSTPDGAPRFPSSILRNKDGTTPANDPRFSSNAGAAFMGKQPAPPQSELLPQSINSGLDMFPFLTAPKQEDPRASAAFFRKPSTDGVKGNTAVAGKGSFLKKDNTPLGVAAPSVPNASPSTPVRQESAEGAGLISSTPTTPTLPGTPTSVVSTPSTPLTPTTPTKPPASILKKESSFSGSSQPGTPTTPVTPVSLPRPTTPTAPVHEAKVNPPTPSTPITGVSTTPNTSTTNASTPATPTPVVAKKEAKEPTGNNTNVTSNTSNNVTTPVIKKENKENTTGNNVKKEGNTSSNKKQKGGQEDSAAAPPAENTGSNSNTTAVKKEKESSNTSSSHNTSGLLGKRKAQDDTHNSKDSSSSSSSNSKSKSDQKSSHKSSNKNTDKDKDKTTEEPDSKKAKVSSSSSKDKDDKKKQDSSSKSSSHKDGKDKKSTSSNKHSSSSSTKSPDKKHKNDNDKKDPDKQHNKSGDSKSSGSSSSKDKSSKHDGDKSGDSKTKGDSKNSDKKSGDKKDSSHSKSKLADTKHKDKSKDTCSQDKLKGSGGGSGKGDDKHKSDKHKHHSREHSTEKTSKSEHSDKSHKTDSKAKKDTDKSEKSDHKKSEHNSDNKKGEHKDGKSATNKEQKHTEKKADKSSTNPKDSGGNKTKHVKEKEGKDKGGEDRAKHATNPTSSEKKKPQQDKHEKPHEKHKEKPKQEKVSNL